MSNEKLYAVAHSALEKKTGKRPVARIVDAVAAAVRAENAQTAALLRELVEAEWMVSHEWRGGRKSVLDRIDAALTQQEPQK